MHKGRSLGYAQSYLIARNARFGAKGKIRMEERKRISSRNFGESTFASVFRAGGLLYFLLFTSLRLGKRANYNCTVKIVPLRD